MIIRRGNHLIDKGANTCSQSPCLNVETVRACDCSKLFMHLIALGSSFRRPRMAKKVDKLWIWCMLEGDTETQICGKEIN